MKPLADFYTCRRAHVTARRPTARRATWPSAPTRSTDANPRAARIDVTRMAAENPERYRQRQREYVESGKKAIANRKSHLKRKYGLSLEQYDAMLAAQGGVCAICHQPRPEERTLHVDHDHATGRSAGCCASPATTRSVTSATRPSSFHAAADYLDRDDDLTRRAAARGGARLGLTTGRRPLRHRR